MNSIYKENYEKLKNCQKAWAKELYSQNEYFSGNKFSNPYYACIPKGWYESPVRILVVGEEGHGDWGCGKKDGYKPYDVDFIQKWNWQYLSSNTRPKETMVHELYKCKENEKVNKSAFWKRIRILSDYGICAWTNIDKIHILGNKCALLKRDRINLHSTKRRILHDEIDVLKPTHVIFFGWYGISLEHELPEVYKLLYPNGPKDSSVWKNGVIDNYVDGIHYIATYHPNWGYRHQGYEDKVLNVFKGTL